MLDFASPGVFIEAAVIAAAAVGTNVIGWRLAPG